VAFLVDTSILIRLANGFDASDTEQRNRASFDRQDGATAAIHGPGHGTGAHGVRSRITIFFVERALIRDVA
jgi:hypothetical protein